MKTYLIVSLLLALHLSGIVMMAGATLMDYITFRTFWAFADVGDNRGIGLLQLMVKYGDFIRAGGAVIIITGLAMFAIDKGARENELWFRVKMVLVFLLVVNGMFAGNKYGEAFRKEIAGNGPDFTLHSSAQRVALGRFYIVQLSLFLLIILASTIKSDGIKTDPQTGKGRTMHR